MTSRISMPPKAKHRHRRKAEAVAHSQAADEIDFANDEDIKIPELRPIPFSIARPDDCLCDTCKSFNLKPSLFVVRPGQKTTDPNILNDNRMKLGLAENVKKRIHCPLCRLVLTALGPKVPSIHDGSRVEVVMRWDTDGHVPTGKEYYDHTPEIRLLRPNLVKERTIDYIIAERDALNQFPEITLLANDAPSTSKVFFPRLIHDQIDFTMVQQWLKMCISWHGDECTKSRLLDPNQKNPTIHIPHFRLIDVVDNCIVPAPPGSQYITLSYVWGQIDPESILRTLKENITELEKPGSLDRPEYKSKISLTIRDAMEVVAKLNFRYLWVDSLCIVQDDDGPDGSKMGAITNMNIIYGAAHLTIMALTGNDANAGLPGLRPDVRRNTQGVEEISPGFRLAVRPSWLDPVSDATTYYSRGWTFQEQQLCIRSLMFIGGQAVFSCKGTSQWREDVVCEDRRTEHWGALHSNKFLNEINPFLGLISSYSARSLTHQTDIYHAFAGMTYGFKSALGTNLCHGLPAAYFDWFLLWTTAYNQKRRAIAPSWSWSGWIGTSKWDPSSVNNSIPKIRRVLRSRTWVIWYQRKAHDSEECIRVWTPENLSSGSKPKNFYGGAVQNRFPFDCSRTIPTPRKLTNAPRYLEDAHNPLRGSGFLQFWTVSIMFKLDKPRRKERGWPGLMPNVNTRVQIFGHRGHEIGTIFVSPDWAERKVPNVHEFIILCEWREEGEDLDEKDESKWKFQMMLIEWHGEWAERVSISSLDKEHLKHALGKGPVWKEIILG